MQGLTGGRAPVDSVAALRTSTGFFERLRRGFRLIKVSWQVLKLDPELMVFPLVSAAIIIALAWVFLSQIAGVPFARWGDEIELVSKPLLWAYFSSVYLVGVFCQAAVVAGATIRFSGENPRAPDGLRVAFSRFLPLVGWALIASTVALAIRWLEDAAKGKGMRWVVSLIDIAWQAATYFAIPVILYESMPAHRAIKRSGQLFKKNWSETLVGMFGIGLAMSLVLFGVIFVSVLIAVYITASVGVALMLVGFTAVIVVGSTLSAICNAALYQFAITGEPPIPFSYRDVMSSGHVRAA